MWTQHRLFFLENNNYYLTNFNGWKTRTELGTDSHNKIYGVVQKEKEPFNTNLFFFPIIEFWSKFVNLKLTKQKIKGQKAGMVTILKFWKLRLFLFNFLIKLPTN